VVYAVQGEKNSRKIRFDLFNGGVQWEIDKNASILISYKKPDGHGGMYDVLDSGESAFEFVENSTNSVIITLAKQVLTTVGNVPLMVSFMVGDKILSTFSITLDVSENPGIDVAESEDYFSLSAAIDAAKKVVGEMLDPNAFASKEYVDGLATDIREEIEEVSNDSKVFYVTFLETDGTFSADKGVPIIAAAKQKGRSVKALFHYNGEIIAVPLIGIIEEDTAYYAGYGIYGTYVVISQTDIKVSVFVENLDCGIHPVAKTEDMTQPVGVDELGGLWSVSGGSGGNANICNFTTTSEQEVNGIKLELPATLSKFYIVEFIIDFADGLTEATNLVFQQEDAFHFFASPLPANTKQAVVFGLRRSDTQLDARIISSTSIAFPNMPAGSINISNTDKTITICSYKSEVNFPAGTSISVWGVYEQ
jgi:hypothetical protein